MILTNILEQRFFLSPVSLFLACQLGVSQSPANHNRIGYTLEFMLTQDHTIIMPDKGKAYHFQFFSTPSFGLQVDIPFNKNFSLETGYRFKEHGLCWKASVFERFETVVLTHSIPWRIAAKMPLGRKDANKRFSASLSGGILMDFMQTPPSAFPLGITATSTGNHGRTFTLIENFENGGISPVHTAIALDGRAKIGFRIRDYLQAFVGFGFTKGFRSLAKGTYTITADGYSISGTLQSKGTYNSWILGLRLMLGKEK